jgi:hypothetical protein
MAPKAGNKLVTATKYRRLVEVKLSPGTFRKGFKSNCSTDYSIRARALSRRESSLRRCGKGMPHIELATPVQRFTEKAAAAAAT